MPLRLRVRGTMEFKPHRQADQRPVCTGGEMRPFLAIVLALVFSLCPLLGIAPIVAVPPTASPTASPTVTLTTTSQPTRTPTKLPTVTATPRPTHTATPLPDIGGLPFVGYWLKVAKEFNEFGSHTMTLYYQDGYSLEAIATFCVRASDNNSPNGFYFIILDRGTVYSSAPGEYKTVYFSHNFGWKYATRSWYLHPAPWNDAGEKKCPVNNTGGCVNMRPDDFDIILNGGAYTSPLTGETSTIPNLGVGTPFVIVDTEETCTYLGTCMDAMQCRTGRECFRKYSCEFCGPTWGTRYNDMLDVAPNLRILDKERP